MVQLTNNHWAIQVPDDAQELDISYGRLIWVTRDSVGYETLTEGSWQYLFTTKEATEEDARKVVGNSEWFFPERHIRYVDYAHPFRPGDKKQLWDQGFGTAIESLPTLLKAKGLNPDLNYAVIQNTNNRIKKYDEI